MTPHVALFADELPPIRPGGAGELVSALALSLAQAGFRCSIVADISRASVDRACGAHPGVMIHALEALADDVEHRGSHYERQASRFARAFERLHRSMPIDIAEFVDYAGMASHVVRVKSRTSNRTRIVVRAHGTLGLIDRAEGIDSPNDERHRMRESEGRALVAADAVLVPSAAIGDEYRRTYGIRPEALLVAPPPMERILAPVRGAIPWSERDRLVDPHHFLFYGKLQEVKGCDLFIDAGVRLIQAFPGAGWRLTLVGRDTQCTRHARPVSTCLEERIPPRLQDAFEFIPSIPRTSLRGLRRFVSAAVFPSRFETFCLAAHELRAIGLPLITSDIPGLRAYLGPSTGALPFNGTADGLFSAMRSLVVDPVRRARLEMAPMPEYGDFLGPYAELTPIR